MARDRAVLVFSYLFPSIFFFMFAQLFDARQSPGAMAQVLAMVIVIGILGSGFFGAGMRAVQERETNILRRFKVAPISAAPIIVASLVSGLVNFLPVVAFYLILSCAYYKMPWPHNMLSLFVFVSIGIVAFRAAGMIVASVVNSAQEAQLVTQILYLPMLFLSGATIPVSVMPGWIQIVANFLPATYLYQGIESILIGGASIAATRSAVVGLLITLAVSLFVGVKLFRWEKEEKIRNSAKLWILAVLAPFIVMGVYQARTGQSTLQNTIMARNILRSRSYLFQNANIFVGNGRVIQGGSVLVRNGKIAEVYEVAPGNLQSLNAEIVNAVGKTIIPGLIDMHVHLGAPGGIYSDSSGYSDPKLAERRLAAYLYSGITAVRSTGDWLTSSFEWRHDIQSGEYLGAEPFICGPLFTTPGGHGTEYYKNLPQNQQKLWEKEFVRLPASQGEARKEVDALHAAGIDCIKAVLESGNSSFGLFNHMDAAIYRAVISEAQADHLPSATHTGNAGDVKEAADAGSSSIEHGSMNDLIPASTWAEMKEKNLVYDPTLSVYEAQADFANGNPELLTRSLVQQVGPANLIASTRAAVEKNRTKPSRDFAPLLVLVNKNLVNAYKAGVTLITGTDAGNILVIHGPTVQHELELWVKAGIPPAIALEAATYNAAKVLGASGRIGSIQKGRDATFVLLEGDPLVDIANTERIAMVMFRGERIDRSALFNQTRK
jgi:imidazolonepropionase-like amidohydrolase/ABC-type multidrug transport system permease subunit